MSRPKLVLVTQLFDRHCLDTHVDSVFLSIFPKFFGFSFSSFFSNTLRLKPASYLSHNCMIGVTTKSAKQIVQSLTMENWWFTIDQLKIGLS